jgi:hypothetical protein
MHPQPLSIPSDDLCQATIGTSPHSASAISNIEIVALLIVDCASLLYASASRPPYKEALEFACLRYHYSDTQNAIRARFPSPGEYSVSEITDFVLANRLK